MKAIVEKAWESGESLTIVSLRTDCGTLTGQWDGLAPRIGSTVYVELELEPDEVRESSAQDFLVSSPDPTLIQLVGIAEAWSDCLLDIGVGNFLISIEAPQGPAIGSWLTVRGHDLKLFDTNL